MIYVINHLTFTAQTFDPKADVPLSYEEVVKNSGRDPNAVHHVTYTAEDRKGVLGPNQIVWFAHNAMPRFEVGQVAASSTSPWPINPFWPTGGFP